MFRSTLVAGAISLACFASPALADTPASATVDLNVTLTKADGTTKSGQVVGVARSEDWYAEKGWTDKPVKLTVTLEGNGTEVEKAWPDIRSVEIEYGASADEVDCQFDSSFSPIMYMCVLKTKTKVTLADGSSWDGISRHKWKLTFADGSAEELWLYKVPHREQEAEVASLGDNSGQDNSLYEKLQTELLEQSKAGMVTKITVKP